MQFQGEAQGVGETLTHFNSVCDLSFTSFTAESYPLVLGPLEMP